MKVLITGVKGFIGKNLVATLNEINKKDLKYELIEITRNNSEKELIDGVKESDLIIHLAGINRPKYDKEFKEGNADLTAKIVNILKENNKKTPIIMTSSIQADLDNLYGRSKKEAEDILLDYSETARCKVYIYRLPNVFGKWCKPNYNSAIATFCNNIANGESIWISDSNKEMTLVYVDDVVRNIINIMESNNINGGYLNVDIEYTSTLGEIVSLINSFRDSRKSLIIPNMKNEFEKKLYSTYLSYLPNDEFAYPLKMNVDNRGSFTEFLKSDDRGQVSINISKPGITKGNHWHNTKNEKFLVVKGNGVIKFRKIDSDDVIEYKVSDENLEVIDIPVGYTHNITNLGSTDMVTVMWVNEIFNSEEPDTYYLEV